MTSREVSHYNPRLLGTGRVFLDVQSTDISQALTTNREVAYNTLRTLKTLTAAPSLKDIPGFKNRRESPHAYRAFLERYAEQKGSQDGETLMQHKVTQALGIADDVMRVFEDSRSGLLKNFSTILGTTTEIANSNDPLFLLATATSSTIPRSQQYESRRKLLIGDLAMNVLQAKDAMQDDMQAVESFFHNFMWVPTPQMSLVEVITDHSPTNYTCERVSVLSPDEKPVLSPYRRYTPFAMRSWADDDNKKQLVYIDHHLKPDPLLVLEMMAQGKISPKEVKDYLELSFVFLSQDHIPSFLAKLKQVGTQQGIPISFSFASQEKGIKAPGVYPMNVKINNLSLVFSLYDMRGYMNSKYQDTISTSEAFLDSLFEKGVIDRLYPPDVIGQDISVYRPQIIRQSRETTRESGYVLPPQRRAEKQTIIPYSPFDLTADVSRIIGDLEEVPDILVAIGNSALPAVREVSEALGGIEIVIYDQETNSLPEIDSQKKILIVDDVGEKGRNIKQVQSLFPSAKTAVLAYRPSKDKHAFVPDYYGRLTSSKEHITFFWEHPGLSERIARVHARALIYTVKDDTIYFLAEVSGKSKARNLKLPGGLKERSDGDVVATIIRELEEEMGYVAEPEDLKRLPDIKYTHYDTKDVNTHTRHAFSVGFAMKVDSEFIDTLKPNTKEAISAYRWVTAETLSTQAKWDSYRTAIPTWAKIIESWEIQDDS